MNGRDIAVTSCRRTRQRFKWKSVVARSTPGCHGSLMLILSDIAPLPDDQAEAELSKLITEAACAPMDLSLS